MATQRQTTAVAKSPLTLFETCSNFVLKHFFELGSKGLATRHCPTWIAQQLSEQLRYPPNRVKEYLSVCAGAGIQKISLLYDDVSSSIGCEGFEDLTSRETRHVSSDLSATAKLEDFDLRWLKYHSQFLSELTFQRLAKVTLSCVIPQHVRFTALKRLVIRSCPNLQLSPLLLESVEHSLEELVISDSGLRNESLTLLKCLTGLKHLELSAEPELCSGFANLLKSSIICPQLEVLIVWGTSFVMSEEVLYLLLDAKSLKHLDLSWMSLDSHESCVYSARFLQCYEALTKLNSFKVLKTAANPMTRHQLVCINNIPSLEVLDISYIKFEDVCLFLGALKPDLKQLHLDLEEGDALQVICSIEPSSSWGKSLEGLSMRTDHIHDIGGLSKVLRNASSRINSLFLGRSPDLTDKAISKIFSKCSSNSLTVLHVTHCKLSSLACFRDYSLTNVAELDLSFTMVDDTGIRGLTTTSLPNLLRLNLQRTAITNKSLQVLGNCTRLTFLDISENLLCVGLLKHLRSLKRLRDLIALEMRCGRRSRNCCEADVALVLDWFKAIPLRVSMSTKHARTSIYHCHTEFKKLTYTVQELLEHKPSQLKVQQNEMRDA
eukprot:TRINITY_DN10449_c0_g1_i1.p1 TRINITY_DN10449_c0_g1~~TRINITY_DN10449_c0_g1_i1.p1  ORF type:complete len:618 (+),score=127.62 TRINITY_DN10449_c0_g1_i1:42-1856(+)